MHFLNAKYSFLEKPLIKVPYTSHRCYIMDTRFFEKAKQIISKYN